MTTLFVTSSGTEIGKTFISALLIRQLRAKGRTVSALKPVVSGVTADNFSESDTAILIDALGQSATHEVIEAISPWRFEAALSPDMASALEGRSIDFYNLIDHCLGARTTSEDILLIEGVGGVMVPLDDSHLVLDWITALASHITLRPLLVVGSYLGSMSHTLTSSSVMAQHGIPPVAVIVSESMQTSVPLDATVATLTRFLPDTPVLTLPRLRPGEDREPDFSFLIEDDAGT